MQPESIPSRVKPLPDHDLWLGVLSFDARHHSGASSYIDYIGHSVIRVWKKKCYLVC